MLSGWDKAVEQLSPAHEPYIAAAHKAAVTSAVLLLSIPMTLRHSIMTVQAFGMHHFQVKPFNA